MFASFGFFHLVSSVVFPWVVCLLRSFCHSFIKIIFLKEVKETRVTTMGVFVTPHDSRCLRVQGGGGVGGWKGRADALMAILLSSES